MSTRIVLSSALVLMAAASLTACSGPEDELQSWMNQQRQQVRPNVQPLSAPMTFTPEPYSGMEGTEPFSPRKLTGALKQEAAQPNSLVASELNRRKEPLEAEPLDAIAMVGLLDRKGQRVALVKVGALLYQVRVGNYLGQNYGRILRISESDITLREIVQDGTGEWIERQAVLQLQEGIK